MSGYPNYWRPGSVSKYMAYVPYWFKRKNGRWNCINRDDFRISGIILCYLFDAVTSVNNLCAISLHTRNVAITPPIKFGVKKW